jgi:hypothetical protein
MMTWACLWKTSMVFRYGWAGGGGSILLCSIFCHYVVHVMSFSSYLFVLLFLQWVVANIDEGVCVCYFVICMCKFEFLKASNVFCVTPHKFEFFLVYYKLIANFVHFYPLCPFLCFLSFLSIVLIVSFFCPFCQIFTLSISIYCLFCPFYILQAKFQICWFCVL